MKSIVLSLFIFCSSISLQAQFTVLQTSTNEDLNDVHFINPQVGFAVGENGAMVKTTNGGDNWTTLNLSTSVNLSKVQFIDANLGFVLSDTILFKTIDGGVNFTSQVFSETLRDLHFISATDGKMAGYKNGSVVLSTSDGGNNFSAITIDASSYFFDTIQGIGVGNYYTLDCINYTNGQWEVGGSNYDYNGGDYPYALHSVNGMLWSEDYLPLDLLYGDSDAKIIDIAANSSGDIFHLKIPRSDETYLYKNQTKVLTESQQPFNKIDEFGFLNDSILFIPTNGNIRIYNTNDGFSSLTEQVIDSIMLTGGVGMVNNTIGFFTGENGQLAKYTDLVSSNQNVALLDFKIFPNPARDYLIIEPELKNPKIEVLDINGRVLSSHLSVSNNQIDLSNLSSGIYFIRLISPKNSHVKMFIKE